MGGAYTWSDGARSLKKLAVKYLPTSSHSVRWTGHTSFASKALKTLNPETKVLQLTELIGHRLGTERVGAPHDSSSVPVHFSGTLPTINSLAASSLELQLLPSD
ncbi:hypothetical protein CEXT_615281 [Caerostris extrusa]|uniref:Uncharacterized protein n=1 Tax=Caerostris extrusa TaxID=172846 RepID=A0AAV4XRV1_CAEEX|nr:hypothetical protein CEXT_615281 [Caerostris extrusa]